MENKKVKFNGMDAFIVIMAAVIIAGGLYFLFGRSNPEQGEAYSKNVNVVAVVELTGKDKEFAELVREGDVVAIGEKEKMMTNVRDVEVVPAKTAGYDILEGRVLRSPVPDEYDVRMTLVGEGAETNSSIELNGTAIKVGQYVVVSSKQWAGQGYIIGLDTEE